MRPGEPSPFVLLSFVTALLSFAVTVDVVRRRPARGALPFAAMTLGTGLYALCYAVGLASVTLDEKILWTRLMYVCFMPLPPGLLAFAQRYTERKGWLRWYTPLLLAIEPVLTLALIWTNHTHHWMWTSAWLEPYYGSLATLHVTHGPWFWVHTVYSYGLVLWAFALLAGAYVHSSRPFRRQLGSLLLSMSAPFLAYTLVVSRLNPIDPLDPMPFVTALAVIGAALGLRRFRLFELLPIARHALVERIEEGMVVVNADGFVVDINSAVLRLLGQERARVVGQQASPLLPFYAELEGRHRDSSTVHAEIAWPAETRRHFDVHMSPLYDRHGNLGGHLFVLHDITERKQAEEEARQRNQQLATLYDTALEVASRLDLAQLLPTIVERAALLLHGTGCGMYLYRPAEDRLEQVAAYGLPELFIGHSLQRGEGVSGRVLDSGQPLAVDDYDRWEGRSSIFAGQMMGAVLGVPVKWGERVLGVIDLERAPGSTYTPEDIRLLTLFANQAAITLANAQLYESARRELAERKSAEAQLRESEQRYRGVVEDQAEQIYRFTPDYRTTFVNEAACRFLGKTREEVIGRSILDDVPEVEQALVRQAIASITREVPVTSMENRIMDAGGREHWFQWTDRGIFDERGTLIEYQAVGRDVSERRRAEEEREKLQAQLQQAQRVEAVGVLAGGVAHEFNNLLTVIEGNAELALADLGAGHPQSVPLATVIRTAQRAATLTRQLLAFSRRQVLERREVELNKLIGDFGGILQLALGAGVRLQLDLAQEARPVLADAAAIEQVLTNLTLNARDAMPRGGELCIATAPAILDDGFCRTRGELKPGEYVRLTVSDTGEGMDPAILRHMFEPFFTTKEVGKGTGLGLAVVYGIIRQHEGWIEAQSRVGQGTRIDVYLPVYDRH